MELRRAKALEAEELTRIAQESKRFWKYPEQWISLWKEALTVTPDFVFWNDVFIATNEDESLGFYALVNNKERLILEHLWVKPKYIGKGIGRKLLRHAVNRAIALNATSIEIVSDPNAEDFYKKMGAKRIGEEITFMEGMERVLPRLQIDVEAFSEQTDSEKLVFGRFSGGGN